MSRIIRVRTTHLKKTNCKFFVILFFLNITACNQATNYPDAYIISKGKQNFIKVRGKRNLMAHDLISLFENKTYEDSDFIPIPSISEKKIAGKNIIFDNGYSKFSYDGFVLIQDDQLTVALYTYLLVHDKKTRYDYEYNGKYLLRKEHAK